MMSLQTPSTVFESPHSKMGKIIELAWGFSTVLGILLFLVEIMIIRCLGFSYLIFCSAGWSSILRMATMLLPLGLPLVSSSPSSSSSLPSPHTSTWRFFPHFESLNIFLQLVGHKSEVYEHNLKELELLKDQLDIEDQDVQSGVGNHII